MPDSIDVCEFNDRVARHGMGIAIVRVGQRDTRWFTPLTVSGGYQGEEGNHELEALADLPRLQAPFILPLGCGLHIFHG